MNSKAEGGRLKAENHFLWVSSSSFILHPSAFSLSIYA